VTGRPTRGRTSPREPAGAATGWSSWSEIPAVVRNPVHLRRTLAVALVVGTILFLVNQLDVVLSGDATTVTWIKVVVTFVVPFCVANFGVLSATRREPPEPRVEEDGAALSG
jgi:hypothetical protein